MSKYDLVFPAQVVGALGGIALSGYLIVAFFVGVTNAQNQMNWCQYKNGRDPASHIENVKETGKRWSPNPATIGLTGECINPGDKGL